MFNGMNDGRRLLSLVLLGATLFSTARASAQTAPAAKTQSADPRMRSLLDRATRMQDALARLANENSSAGGSALLKLLVGVAYGGLGVGMALDKHEPAKDSFSRAVAVTESVAIGGSFLGMGVYDLSGGSSVDEHRYARFVRDVRAHQMTELRMEQYEGELYADAIISRTRRRTGAWANLGGALAGAGLIALAATSDMRGGARAFVYLEGAVLTPVCAISGIVELNHESANEREWRRYRSPKTAAPAARLLVWPLLTRNSALLVTGGTF
jgi:hypothetical protein